MFWQGDDAVLSRALAGDDELGLRHGFQIVLLQGTHYHPCGLYAMHSAPTSKQDLGGLIVLDSMLCDQRAFPVPKSFQVVFCAFESSCGTTP